MNASLTPEQKSVLVSAYRVIESAAVYLRAVLPVVSGTDEQPLSGLVELAEISLKRLPQQFPELAALDAEWKSRGGL